MRQRGIKCAKTKREAASRYAFAHGKTKVLGSKVGRWRPPVAKQYAKLVTGPRTISAEDCKQKLALELRQKGKLRE